MGRCARAITAGGIDRGVRRSLEQQPLDPSLAFALLRGAIKPEKYIAMIEGAPTKDQKILSGI
ncbi:MAG: hypothetical protein ACO2O0_12665, partial [Desulfurococcales archaeon]